MHTFPDKTLCHVVVGTGLTCGYTSGYTFGFAITPNFDHFIVNQITAHDCIHSFLYFGILPCQPIDHRVRHCPQRFDGKQVNIPGRNIIRGNQLIHPAKRAAEQFQQRLILRFALLNLVKPFLIVDSR